MNFVLFFFDSRVHFLHRRRLETRAGRWLIGARALLSDGSSFETRESGDTVLMPAAIVARRREIRGLINFLLEYHEQCRPLEGICNEFVARNDSPRWK